MVDQAYLDVIDSAIANKSLSWIQRMDILLSYLKENKKADGGISLTLNPTDDNISNEDIAHDFCMVERARASGKLTITTEIDL